MKTMRIPAFLMLFAVVFSFFGCGGEEDASKPTELYTYTVMGEGEDASVALSKYTGSAEKVTVPSEYNGMPVTTIGAHCFSYHAEIAEITLPSSIVSIGDFAFQACTKLENVTLPDSVVTMGQGAFADCTALQAVKLSEKLTVISERAFANTGIESVVIGENIKIIQKYAFEQCKGLKSVTVSESVISFGDGVFCDCTAIEKLTFGYNVVNSFRRIFSKGEEEDSGFPQPKEIEITSGEVLPRDTFSGCLKLERIVFPDTMTEIGEMALMNCLALREVKLPSGLKVLRESVFQNCESLQTVVLPDGLEEIEIFSFAGCLALKEVTVPASVVKIDEMVFEDASLLPETVIVCPADSAMEKYAKENGLSCRNA